MATTLDTELLVGLREELLVGLSDAAERNLSLSAHGLGSAECVVVAAREVLEGYEALPLLEAIVVGMRFSPRGSGLGRVPTARLLGLTVCEVERLESSALTGLSLVTEVR